MIKQKLCNKINNDVCDDKMESFVTSHNKNKQEKFSNNSHNKNQHEKFSNNSHNKNQHENFFPLQNTEHFFPIDNVDPNSNNYVSKINNKVKPVDNNEVSCLQNYTPMYESVGDVCTPTATFKNELNAQGLNFPEGFDSIVNGSPLN